MNDENAIPHHLANAMLNKPFAPGHALTRRAAPLALRSMNIPTSISTNAGITKTVKQPMMKVVTLNLAVLFVLSLDLKLSLHILIFLRTV
jgi:hypothetical protein